MKKIAIILLMHFSITLLGQSPDKMSFQAVLRDSNMELIANTKVGMRVSIIQFNANGSPVYSELHYPLSNDNGLISLEIGSGTVTEGEFSSIDWSNGPYWIRTETDLSGGDIYTIISESQLLSVPYALYAKESGSSLWSKNSDGIHYDDDKVGIGTQTPENKLHISADNDSGNRTLLQLENLSGSTTSSAAMEIKSGSNTNLTTLRMHGDNYSYSWWGKHGQLRTTGDGLIIEATKSNGEGGDLAFVNGIIPGSPNFKQVNMKISGDGDIGINTETPKEKLHINGGNIYIEGTNQGLIMESPDGNCWIMSVSNTGEPVYKSITCP